MDWSWGRLILIAAVVYLAYLARGFARGLAAQGIDYLADPEQGLYSADYPVFSRKQVFAANREALERMRDADRVNAELMKGDREIQAARASGKVSDALAARMLRICRDRLKADEAWFRHAIYMEANVSVTTGRATREQAFAAALQRLHDPAQERTVAEEATRRRDWWKATLEGQPVADTPQAVVSEWHKWFSDHPEMLSTYVPTPRT